MTLLMFKNSSLLHISRWFSVEEYVPFLEAISDPDTNIELLLRTYNISFLVTMCFLFECPAITDKMAYCISKSSGLEVKWHKEFDLLCDYQWNFF